MHVRSHLDYCDFIYHIPELKKEKEGDGDVFDGYEENAIDHEDENADVETSDLEGRRKINLNFRMRALESIQYQAALAITGAWKGTNPSRRITFFKRFFMVNNWLLMKTFFFQFK